MDCNNNTNNLFLYYSSWFVEMFILKLYISIYIYHVLPLQVASVMLALNVFSGSSTSGFPV